MAFGDFTLAHRNGTLTAVVFRPLRGSYSRELNQVATISGRNQPGTPIITARSGRAYYTWSVQGYVSLLQIQQASIIFTDQDLTYQTGQDGHFLLTDECRFSEPYASPHPQTLIGTPVSVGAFTYGYGRYKIKAQRSPTWGDFVGRINGQDAYLLDFTAEELPN